MKFLIPLIIILAATSPALTEDAPASKTTGPAKAKYDKAAAALRARYLSDLEKLQKEYMKDLTAAHAEAVKRKDLAEAQQILAAIEAVQDEMEAQKLPPANLLFRKGSRWQGTHTHNGRDYAASLAVTSRTAEKFDGILEWQHEATGHVVVLVEGKVEGDEVTFEMKKIQNGRNVIFPVTYTGKLAGKSLKGTWRNPDQTAKGEFSYAHQP